MSCQIERDEVQTAAGSDFNFYKGCVSFATIFCMSEFIPITHQHARRAASVLTALGAGRNLGVTYNTIIVSSTDPGVIDTYDTGILSLMRYATLYWPGGNPDQERKVEMIVQGDLPPNSAAEAARVKRLLLGASIGAAALARVPDHFRDVWGATDSFAPGVAVESFREHCKDLRLPFAICTISDVTNGDPGRSIMHLFHPLMVAPGPSLEVLQKAVAANGI